MNYNQYMPNYVDLNFKDWSIVKYTIPGDGHCLFHALSLGFFKPYIVENFKGNSISRKQVVCNLRKELSEKLTKHVNGKNGPTYYDLLNNGNTLKFSKSVPEYSLASMQAELYSEKFIGYSYIEYIGNELNKDIYIINGDIMDLYQSDELSIKHRNSIVLYYKDNHFELIGLNQKNQIVTHFKPDHAFIKFLYSRIKCI